MFKAGQIYRYQIYRYAGGAQNIYVRLLPFKSDQWVNLIVLAGTRWDFSRWVTGNVITDYAYLDDWTLMEEENCLKCLKKNPCRAMEVLCPECKAEFGVDFKK